MKEPRQGREAATVFCHLCVFSLLSECVDEIFGGGVVGKEVSFFVLNLF